jgi:hypothetical protein
LPTKGDGEEKTIMRFEMFVRRKTRIEIPCAFLSNGQEFCPSSIKATNKPKFPPLYEVKYVSQAPSNADLDHI